MRVHFDVYVFLAIFTKGSNVSDFMFASLATKPFQEGMHSKRKEFCPRKAFFSLNLIEKGGVFHSSWQWIDSSFTCRHCLLCL